MVKEHGSDKAPQVCIIFDDVIADSDLMKQAIFIKCFIASRHYNATTFLCAQHFTRIPKICRLQASAMYFFACSLTEAIVIAEQLAPPMMPKKTLPSNG